MGTPYANILVIKETSLLAERTSRSKRGVSNKSLSV